MSQKAKMLLVMVVVIVAGVIMFKPVYDQQHVPLHKRISDYEGALQTAKDQGKPIFLEFFSET